jgi:hypothetical protein
VGNNFKVRNLMVTLEPNHGVDCPGTGMTPRTCVNISHPHCAEVTILPPLPPHARALANADMVLCNASTPLHQLGRDKLGELHDQLTYAMEQVKGALDDPKTPATSPAPGPTDADALLRAANAGAIMQPPGGSPKS